MKRTWTIIGVGDVTRSFRWYQALFGHPDGLPAHDYFGQILDSDGRCCCACTNGAPTSIRRSCARTMERRAKRRRWSTSGMWRGRRG